jgi:hypothetical protein
MISTKFICPAFECFTRIEPVEDRVTTDPICKKVANFLAEVGLAASKFV